MAEAAAAAPVGAPSTGTAPPAAAGAPPATPLSSVPTGPDWASGFKDEVKTYVSQKAFKTPEDMAVAYQNLEKMRGVPEERLLKLPEKMEGDEARAVWEKLGTPKEAKEYGLVKDEKAADGGKFTEWAQDAFHKNNLTKTQAQGVAQAYNEKVQADIAAYQAEQKTKIAQGTEALKQKWGPQYEANINLAKQGAKILGLDPKTIDTIEALQGREVLFTNLHKLGVSVGESNFVDGGGTGQPTQKTPEQAQKEIQELLTDQKFGKKVARGDKESTDRWNELNRLAYPGTKQIG